MEFSSSAANGRRAATAVRIRLIQLLFLLFALVGWSDAAIAQSCDLAPITPTSLAGAPGTTLTFEFNGTGACDDDDLDGINDFEGTIALSLDTTGGAVLSTNSFNSPVGVTVTFTVTLGPDPLEAGEVYVECMDANCYPPGTGSVRFEFETTAVPTTTVEITANPVTIVAGDPTRFAVQVRENGVPLVNETVTWSNDPTFSTLSAATSLTDTSGIAEIDVTGLVPGTINQLLSAGVNPDGARSTGDESGVIFDYSITAGFELNHEQGDGQTETVGTPYAQNLIVAAADGLGNNEANVPITWTVQSGTADIDLSPGGSTTDSGGEAAVIVTPRAPGTIEILAERTDHAIPGVLFTLAATPAAVTITEVTTNPANAFVGVAQDYTVLVEQGGAPVNGATVTWTPGANFTAGPLTGTTNASGEATLSMTPTGPPGPEPRALIADVDLSAFAGDEATFTFGAQVSGTPTLTIDGGDDNEVEVGQPFPQLSVLAENGGTVAVPAVNIDWQVVSGSGSVTPVTNPTNPTSGIGTANAVAGLVPGNLVIRARRLDGSGISVDFHLRVLAVATAITHVTVDPVAIDLGVPTTFTVNVTQGGAPLGGTTVAWAPATGISVVGGPSITDVNGDASIQLRGDTVGNYPAGVLVTVNPDGITGTGDESSQTFNITVATVPTLDIDSGDDQDGIVGDPLPLVMSVIARDSGAPAGNVGIDWQVTGGSASITPSGVTDPATGEAHLSVTPTAPGTLEITAERLDAPGVMVTFTANVTAAATNLTSVTLNPAELDIGTPTTFTVRVQQRGANLAGVPVTWTSHGNFTLSGGPSVTNAIGRASIDVTGIGPGNFPAGVTATIDPDAKPGSGDESTLPFTVIVAPVPGLTINGGQGQAGTVGSNYGQVLSVIADDSGAPAGGIGIVWTVTGGTATITPSGNTDPTSGEAHLSVIPLAPGNIEITAERADAPGVLVIFNLTATAAATTVTAVSPNPAQLDVGVPATFTVHVEQGGTGLAGVPVEWTAGPGYVLTKVSSTTDGSGDASIIVTAMSTVPNAVVVSVDPDNIAGSGDESGLTFSTLAVTVPELAISAGDGQSALPGFAFTTPLEVLATDSGAAAVNLPIVWTHTGDVTVTPAGNTDSSGKATATVTAGSTVGPATVTATRSDDPSVSVTFNLTVSEFGTLAITGGDGQVLAAGDASEPLEVTLHDENGVPVNGATIHWTTSTGALDSATSTTNAAGVATNTVTISVPGAVEVTASSPLAADPVVFALNGNLGNLPGLDPVQQQVVEAMDNLCPALAAMGSLSPEQADLLERCEELRDAAGIDPDATIVAIDELMTGLALAQGEASLMAAQAQFQNLKTRIAALRAGTVGTTFGGLALNTPTGPVSMETLSSAFSAMGDPASGPAEGTEVGADFSRWGFFAAGNIGRGENDEGSIDPNFDYDIEGITIGVDYRQSDRWIFGAAFGYTKQDTELADGRGDVDTTGWSLSAYSTYYQADSWYLDGVVTWGQNDFGLMRRIDYTVPTPGGGTSTISQEARSDSSGDLLSTGFTFGRDFNRGAFGIGPYVRLLYTKLTFDEINEEMLPGLPGSGLGLTIEERELTSLATVLGGKFTYTYSTDWGVVIPHLQLEWEHEFRDDPQSLEASFLFDPTSTPIVITGDRIDTDFFRLGLGMSMVLTKGRSGFFYYEQVFSRDGSSQYNLALGLRLEF